MSALSTALIVGAITVWIVYAVFRMAPFLEHRWKVWGQVAAYLIFAGVIVLIEVVLSRF